MGKFYTTFLTAVAIAGTWTQISQALKVFQTHSVNDLLPATFVVAAIHSLSWFVHGLIIKDRVLGYSSLLGCAGSLFILLGIYLYS